MAAQIERTTRHLGAGDPMQDRTFEGITITEILGMLPVTEMLPATAPLLGIIIFRGKMVPVVDLRMHAAITLPHLSTERLCILAAETKEHHAPLLLGAVVDSENDAYGLLLSTTH